LWLFGDGLASTQQHPSHTYLLPGIYIVSLTVSSDAGTDITVKPGYITATLWVPW